MKYSVLIPVYKTNKTDLKKCIDSILANNYEDYEIIIVEALFEGQSVCDEIKNLPHVKYFVSDIASAPHQRNLTLEKATGDYIIFVDADDYVSECLFELADKYIGESDLLIMNHTGQGFAFPYSDKVETKINPKEIQSLFHLQNKNIYDFECRSIWAKVYKRSAIIDNNLKFDETLLSTQDYFFNLYLSKYLSIVNLKLDCKIYHYQFSQSSMTKNKVTSSPERFNILIKAWQKFFNKFEKKDDDEMQNYYYNVAMVYIPMMLNNYFENSDDSIHEFELLISTKEYQECIQKLKYNNCLSFKKKVLLFLLKRNQSKLVFKLYSFKSS